MSTDKLYTFLSNQVYEVDAGKNSTPWRAGDELSFAGGDYRIIDAKDNPTNGMQAMAVAPVDSEGRVDYTNITIAYAGTNFGDPKDRQTDLNSVIMGQNQFKAHSHLPNTASQIDTALEFAQEVRNDYPQATIQVTGHSLGGYLGQIVAIKNQWSATIFNGPDPSNMLTAEEIAWAKANTDILVNYRNDRDWIGNTGGELAATVRYVEPYKQVGVVGTVVNILTHHGLATWQFDKIGVTEDESMAKMASWSFI
ncbi:MULTISPECIES: lipase [Streptococcus]|uniref:lipase n=1 Tax=Streptococcus TaxID=1301 RepID=UPI0012DD5CD2|nr:MULTISPECIES: lipase [Streptococcus]QHF54381.1 hypothetical protein BZG42_02970 [Streptococcus sp. DAT741]